MTGLPDRRLRRRRDEIALPSLGSRSLFFGATTFAGLGWSNERLTRSAGSRPNGVQLDPAAKGLGSKSLHGGYACPCCD